MSYMKTRDDVVAVVDRKLAMERPVPMEIGNVGAGGGKGKWRKWRAHLVWRWMLLERPPSV